MPHASSPVDALPDRVWSQLQLAQHGSAVMTNVLLQLDVWYRLGLVCFTLQGTLLLVQYQPCMPVSTN